MAREHQFTVLFDECYSEIYLDTPPTGGLESAAGLGAGLANILVFNSLSKRSSLAGMRSGFCIGDGDIVTSFLKFRNLSAPQLAYPVQAASAAAWNDEDHVTEPYALPGKDPRRGNHSWRQLWFLSTAWRLLSVARHVRLWRWRGSCAHFVA